MYIDQTAAAPRIVRQPVYPRLAAFPAVCFTGALLTDIAYASTADMLWADFSAWLLAAGMVMGVVAGIGCVVDLASGRRVALRRPAWPSVFGGLVVLIVAFVNNLVHSRDAWTSIVPVGLILSAVTVALMLVISWLGSSLVHGRVGREQRQEIRS